MMAKGLSLDAVARSGQVFTWRQTEDGRWLVASGERRCVLAQEDDELEVRGIRGEEPAADDLAYWGQYLALDMPSPLNQYENANISAILHAQAVR